MRLRNRETPFHPLVFPFEIQIFGPKRPTLGPDFSWSDKNFRCWKPPLFLGWNYYLICLSSTVSSLLVIGCECQTKKEPFLAAHFLSIPLKWRHSTTTLFCLSLEFFICGNICIHSLEICISLHIIFSKILQMTLSNLFKFHENIECLFWNMIH